MKEREHLVRPDLSLSAVRPQPGCELPRGQMSPVRPQCESMAALKLGKVALYRIQVRSPPPPPTVPLACAGPYRLRMRVCGVYVSPGLGSPPLQCPEATQYNRP